MPPKRRAAAAAATAATATRTLHSFASLGVSKNITSAVGKGKAKVVEKNISKKPVMEIQQNGDEDVVIFARGVKRKEMAATGGDGLSVSPQKLEEPRKARKKTRITENAKAEDAKAEPEVKPEVEAVGIEKGDEELEAVEEAGEVEGKEVVIGNDNDELKDEQNEVNEEQKDVNGEQKEENKEKVEAKETRTPKKVVRMEDFVTKSSTATPRSSSKNPATPKKSKAKAKATPRNTPSRKNRLASPAPNSTSAIASFFTNSTSKSCSPAPTTVEEELPDQLKLYITLHSSLLTSLLLHRAQMGNSYIPPAFATIKPHIERLSRHNATMDDLRRIVWLSHYGEPEGRKGGLKVTDYGARKIAIEFDEKLTTRKLINTDSIKSDFVSRVSSFFRNHKATTTTGGLVTPPASSPPPLTTATTTTTDIKQPDDGKVDLIEIPLSEITQAPHKSAIDTVLHSRGQRLLTDLLRSKPASKASKAQVTKPTNESPEKRNSSLMERIRAKSAAASAAAATAPSKEETETTAARQKLPDLVPILKSMAREGRNMTMKAVVDGVRNSLKNPLGEAEVERAVKVLSEEGWKGASGVGVDEGIGKVEPGWIRIRGSGKVVGVVFEREEGVDRFGLEKFRFV